MYIKIVPNLNFFLTKCFLILDKTKKLRTVVYKSIENSADFKIKLMHWANQFREVIFLDSNAYPQHYTTFDFALATDAFTSIKTDFHQAFNDLKEYQNQTKDWIFGYLSYDLKNDLERLQSQNFDGLQFPDMFFFQPKKLFIFKDNILEINYLRFCDDEIETDFLEINEVVISENLSNPKIEIQQRISKPNYLQKVEKIKEHIQLGDVYETNFCMEFFAENVTIDMLDTFQKLNKISQPPFSVYFKNHQHFLASASPERFLRKENTKVISQPIKGTQRISPNKIEDEVLQQKLKENSKERAENIMIVDLVRNDLSKVATKGSVQVEELCEIYTFKQVHQMISTVVCEVEPNENPIEIMKAAFPMGSMTGAPKISAMEIIENQEEIKRGLYSGAVGYFAPNGDFDFNVVIRSMLYNNENQYLSFSVGSAITHHSLAENEYEECLLKAKALFEVLQ